MTPVNAGTPWCETQDQLLLVLAACDRTVAEVARMMGRTPQGIVARADRLSYRVNGDGTEQYTMLQAFISTARHQRGAAAPSAIPETSEPKARYLPVAPFLLEVHTEQFYLVLHALEAAGFEVKSRPNLPSRYVVRDTENAGESV